MPIPSTEPRARAQTHQDVRGEWLSSTLLQLVLPVTDHRAAAMCTTDYLHAYLLT